MIGRSDGGYTGGVLVLSAEMAQHGAHPTWLGCLHVADVDRAVKAMVADGGRLLMPRTDLPVGAIAMVTDPMGTPFYLMAPRCHHVKATAVHIDQAILSAASFSHSSDRERAGVEAGLGEAITVEKSGAKGRIASAAYCEPHPERRKKPVLHSPGLKPAGEVPSWSLSS